MSRQQEIICGLSHEVTIAVLPRLNMDELMFELNRRMQNLDKENSIKDRLVSILRDVMLEEYRRLERRMSEVSSPDETTIPVQNHVLTDYAETMLSESSIPDASQQSSGLDIVIKKESDTSSDVLVYTKESEFDTEQIQLTVQQQDQLCNIPSPGSPTIPSCDTPLIQMKNRTDSRIREEEFAMTTENEEARACHDELNIGSPTSIAQVKDTLISMNTSYSETPVEISTPDEEAPSPVEHYVSEDGQILQISQPSIPDQNYTDDGETSFINGEHEQSEKESSEETPLASCPPTPDIECENKTSLLIDNDPQIDSKFKTSLAQSSSKHMKSYKGEKPFMCGECGYRARHKYRLVEHMRKHTGEKPFKCDQCNYNASYKTLLVKHMKSHTDAEPSSCDICEYQTYIKSNVERHMMCHSAVKPYKCEECDFRAVGKSYLVKHRRRRHTGEKPYSCQECDYKASEKDTLLRHMRKKHMSYKQELLYHMKKHTDAEPYSCEICDHKAYIKANFETHMMRHAGVKPYKCEECDYSTAHKSDLIKHKRRHTGERPYGCQECDYKARDKGTLLRHVRRKHV
ncbi:uncharacterized protein LOC144865634 [Branchiostoma floridae x Branchiostoma japonicum]